MRNCIDEGTLQAWFDGELDANASANVAAHLRECVQCARAAETVEHEVLILSQGLSAELSGVIPSEHLRNLIETRVAGLQRASKPTSKPSGSSFARSFFPSFRVLAYASAVAAVLIAGFFLIGYLKKENPAPSANQANPRSAPPFEQPAPEIKPQQVALKQPNSSLRPRRVGRKLEAPEADPMSLRWQEGQYEYAIVKLNEAIKSQAPMRPSLQVQYEYDLAVIDNAIAATRDLARKHPKDPQATQPMLVAYQSKIDLMNQVAMGQIAAR
jgi:anti-sigma factor RsiW